MKSKLDKIPVMAPSLYLDSVQGRVSTAQGTATWFSGGNLIGQNTINTGADASPDCWSGMSFAAANNDGGTGNVYGRSKTNVHSWEAVFRWMNQSNCPVELELYTFRCRKPLLIADHIGGSATSTLRDYLNNWWGDQYQGAPTTSARGVDFPAFKITDVAQFMDRFKLLKVKRVVVQPGEEARFKRWRNKMRTVDEAKVYDTSSTTISAHHIPGDLVYFWRITGTPQSQSGGTSATLCDVKMAFVFTYHFKVSSYSYNNQLSFATVALPAGLSVTNIYPGTSAAAAAAPVT